MGIHIFFFPWKQKIIIKIPTTPILFGGAISWKIFQGEKKFIIFLAVNFIDHISLTRGSSTIPCQLSNERRKNNHHTPYSRRGQNCYLRNSDAKNEKWPSNEKPNVWIHVLSFILFHFILFILFLCADFFSVSRWWAKNCSKYYSSNRKHR